MWFNWSGVGVTEPISSNMLFSEFFHIVKKTLAIEYHIYKCDSNNLKGTLEKSKILLMEKLTNWALVPPPLGPLLLTWFNFNPNMDK